MVKRKKLSTVFINIIEFAILVALVLATALPMQIYAYELTDVLPKEFWILAYGLMVGGIIFIVRKKSKNRDPYDFHEVRRPIDSRWMGKLFKYFLIFAVYSYIQGILIEYMDLGNAMNQAIVENEIVDFPVKPWFYLHMVIIAPVLEELVFRKAFMAMFFTRDNKLNSFLSILCSGLIFGLLHEASISWFLLFYSFSGFILAYIYRSNRDIRLAIGVHSLNNLLSLLAVLMV